MNNLKDINLKDIEESGHDPKYINKVLEYCRYFDSDPLVIKDQIPIETNDINKLVQKWYADYINVSIEDILKIMNLANFMHIESLVELTCLKIATELKDKTPEEIKEKFDISGDSISDDSEDKDSTTVD